MGTRRRNAPYEGRFVERLVAWWRADRAARLQLLFRPHPRDRDWRERFARRARPERHARCRSRATPTSRTLATLLQHADVRRLRTPGTILLDALVNDRPAVCVLYDEGAPAGRVVGAEERRRRALPGAGRLRRLLSRRAVRRGRRRHRALARGAGRAGRGAAPGRPGRRRPARQARFRRDVFEPVGAQEGADPPAPR